MGEVYVYLISMPVREAVTPCADGYTVYINKSLTFEERKKAYLHALRHILNGDFSDGSIQKIEKNAHLNDENADF